MKFLNRLERSLGQFAIPRITFYIVFLRSFAYVLSMAAESRNPEQAAAFIQRLELIGSFVLQGQVWRVLTFVLIPPLTNPFFFFFAMYLLFLMGTALENHWGTFRYNLYLVVGWLATVAVSLALPTGAAANGYLLESVFLAFAFLYPDFELRLFFLLPVKIKWLALIAWIAYFVQFTMGGWLDKCLILAATANFVLFFHGELWLRIRSSNRRMVNKARAVKPIDDAFNRCVLCGVTEKTNPRMEFRYCPKCPRTPCYCIDHIHNHEHTGAASSMKA